jgi:hypothetical protein
MTQTKGSNPPAPVNRMEVYLDRPNPHGTGWKFFTFEEDIDNYSFLHACHHAAVVFESQATNPIVTGAAAANWADLAHALMERLRLERRVDSTEKNLRLLTDRVKKIEGLCEKSLYQAISVGIATFAPEPYEVVKPLHALIRRHDTGFIASFLEANVEAPGTTEHEALENLKGTILNTFIHLSGEEESELDAVRLRQRYILMDLIRPLEPRQSAEDCDCDEETKLFLSKIYGLSRAEETDRGIDHIFEYFEDLFEAARFDACDRIIQHVDLERVDATLMVSFLVITLTVKDRLPSRAWYYSHARSRLVEQRGEEQAERLLRGLE